MVKASDTSALIEVIIEQNKTIESLRKTTEEMSSNIIILREQIGYLNGKLYGTKSEKTAALTGQIVMDEVFEHGQFYEAETEAPPDAEEDLILKKASKRRYLREKALNYLPREEKLYTLSDEDRVCSIDGDRLFPAGKNISELKLNIHLHP